MSDMKERFLEDVKHHEMLIEQDNDVFRSIKFKNPETACCYFRINTWPGHLCISGDMGTYVFSRLHDMFDFFRGDGLSINIGYWTEKLQSVSLFGSNDGSVHEFDPKGTYNNLLRYLKENKEDEANDEIEEKLSGLQYCSDDREAMNIMNDLDISDAWEHLQYVPTFHIQWCLYAICWAVSQYDRT